MDTRTERPERRLEAPSYSAYHAWMRRKHPKQGRCEWCGAEGKTHYAAKDHANYTRNRDDYYELCPRCHVHLDDRVPPSRKGVTITPDHIAALQAGRKRQRNNVGKEAA